jgi:hypothetical protein
MFDQIRTIYNAQKEEKNTIFFLKKNKNKK